MRKRMSAYGSTKLTSCDVSYWSAYVEGFGCRHLMLLRRGLAAGVRKPSMKETAMGGRWRCGLRYGDLCAVNDAPDRRQNASARGPTGTGLMSGGPPGLDE